MAGEPDPNATQPLERERIRNRLGSFKDNTRAADVSDGKDGRTDNRRPKGGVDELGRTVYYDSVDRKRGHSLTLQGGKGDESDTSKLQFGDNYSRLVGDSISLQEGRKQVKHEGMSNSVTIGSSFSSTVGASFSTMTGSSISTMAGAKIALTVAMDFAATLAAKVNVAGAMSFNFEKGPKYELREGTREVVDSKEYAAEKQRAVIATQYQILATKITQDVADLTTRAKNIEDNCTTLTTRAGTIENKFSDMQNKGVTVNFDISKFHCNAAGAVSITGFTIKLG